MLKEAGFLSTVQIHAITITHELLLQSCLYMCQRKISKGFDLGNLCFEMLMDDKQHESISARDTVHVHIPLETRL